MATTITTPRTVRIANGILTGFGLIRPRLTAFAADFTNEFAREKEDLYVRTLKAAPAGDYNRSTNNYGHSDATGGTVKVTLSKHPIAHVELKPEEVEAEEMSEETRASLKTTGESVGLAAWQTVHDAIVAMATASAAKDVSISIDPLAADKEAVRKAMRLIRATAVKADIAPQESVLVVGPDLYSSIVDVYDASVLGDGALVKAGRIDSGLLSFAAIVEDPTLGLADGEPVACVLRRNALGIAGRVVKVRNPKAYEDSGVSSDDKTGFSLTFRQLAKGETDDLVVNAEGLFGTGVVDGAQILRVDGQSGGGNDNTETGGGNDNTETGD